MALLCNWLLLGNSAALKSSPDSRSPLWSLQPIVAPVIPRTRFDRLAQNPIDRFIFERLAAKNLGPAPVSDRLTLLRRVTIDLTGFPPTPEEVESFIGDPSPQAYEKVVDRLLTSSAYGERWARHWLDVVRFGESNGYEQNHLRPNAWHYRDYVIRALNDDRPYKQFVEEQLAGDVVARSDPDREAATGFLVAGVHDTVGNQTLEGTLQQRSNDLDDIVSTIGAAFLGLTVGCAKCHDHKFDPIPQRDYYRMAAVVAGVRHGERAIAVRTPATISDREVAEAEALLRKLQARVGDLDAEARAAVLRARGLSPVPRPAVNARRNVDEFSPTEARFVRLVVLATRDGTQPCLDELEVYEAEGAHNLALSSTGARATASSLLPGYRIHQIQHLNDGRYGNDWSWISNEQGAGWAQIELQRSARIARVVWSRDSAGDRSRFTDRLASAYRLEVSSDGETWKAVCTGDDRAPTPEAIPLNTLIAALTPAQRELRAQLAADLNRLRQRESASSPPTAYVGQFSAPDAVHLLKRGDVMQRGEEVTPGALSRVPAVSPELAIDADLGEPGRRLALARWICDTRNPLTARVIVNRVWQHHFGRGLVGTSSDFGANGEPPTHPELLDWLASDFMENGWTLKRLHKSVVTSYAYRQVSGANLSGMKVDAGNRLLWRMPLRRMEAEVIRDAILAVSGKLNRQMGGPGFQLFKYRIVNVAIYEPLDEPGVQTWRRSIYSQAARAIRDDLMGSFDCPECAQRAPRREVTTTALQALSLLNGTFAAEQAQHFADRVRREADTDASKQVRRAFQLAFGRAPNHAEAAQASDLVRNNGLGALCRALLNANEFLYY